MTGHCIYCNLVSQTLPFGWPFVFWGALWSCLKTGIPIFVLQTHPNTGNLLVVNRYDGFRIKNSTGFNTTGFEAWRILEVWSHFSIFFSIFFSMISIEKPRIPRFSPQLFAWIRQVSWSYSSPRSPRGSRCWSPGARSWDTPSGSAGRSWDSIVIIVLCMQYIYIE